MKQITGSLLLLLLFTCNGENSSDQPTAAETSQVTNAADNPDLTALNNQIRANPRDPALYARRANYFYAEKDYDSAIANLQQAIQLDSTEVTHYYHLSDVYLDYYRSRLALRTLEAAEKLDPNNLETQLRLSRTRLLLKQYDEALRSINEVVRLNPTNPEAYLLLTQVFKETGDTVRALNAAERAAQLDPDLTDAFLTIGQLKAARGDDDALAYFDAAADIDPLDPVPFHARADYLRDAGRTAEAIAAYRGLSRLDRQYVAGPFNAGLLLLEQDSVRAALREFDVTLKNDPVHLRALFFRGYAHELLDETDAARADYRMALRIAPEYEYAREGLARVGD